MSLKQDVDGTMSASFPRVSGDEPVTTKVRTAPIKFSPRERG